MISVSISTNHNIYELSLSEPNNIPDAGATLYSSDVNSGLRGHSLKLFKPRCRTTMRTTVRQNFFSLRVMMSSMNGTSYHKKSWMHRQSTHSKTGWGQTLERYGRLQLTGYTLQPVDNRHQVEVPYITRT